MSGIIRITLSDFLSLILKLKIKGFPDGFNVTSCLVLLNLFLNLYLAALDK